MVGGIDGASTRGAEALYQQVVPKVVTVSGTREAEMSKLIENILRHINIAFINELALYSHEMGIDIWGGHRSSGHEAFRLHAFLAEPCWGGHCIPLEPSYLSWKVRQYRSDEIRFIELAQSINSEMPRYVVQRIGSLLNEDGKSIKNANILCIGVAYKAGSEDVRESAAISVMSLLRDRGVSVRYHDPLVGEVGVDGQILQGAHLDRDLLFQQDLVVILIKQSLVDWELTAKASPTVLDCWNALRGKAGSISRL